MVLLMWQDEDTGQTEFVRFDAVVTEVHEDVVTITDHPVEQGVNVSDHARAEPTRLTLEGVVSNMPNLEVDVDAGFEATDVDVFVMRPPGTQSIALDIPTQPIQPSVTGLINAGVGALTRALTGAPRGTFTGDPSRQIVTARARMLKQREPRNRVRDVYDALLKAKDQALLITVQTTVREHFDMLIERLALPREVGDGGKAKFQVDLRHIRVAESETVVAPKPAEARGQLAKNKGSQGAKADKNSEKKLNSTLKETKDLALGRP